MQNAEIDGLIDQADAQIDMTKRQEIYDELQNISVEQQPVSTLFNEKTLMVYNTKLTGYEAQIYDMIFLKLAGQSKEKT